MSDYRMNVKGFTDKDGGFWCGFKGGMCAYATIYGQCSLTACRRSWSSPVAPNTDQVVPTVSQNTLPDSLIINGQKYIKADS